MVARLRLRRPGRRAPLVVRVRGEVLRRPLTRDLVAPVAKVRRAASTIAGMSPRGVCSRAGAAAAPSPAGGVVAVLFDLPIAGS